MEHKEVLELDLKSLEDHQAVQNNNFRFITSCFGFVMSLVKMEPVLFKVGQPYRIKEGRIVLVERGWVCLSLNLIEYTFEENTLSLISSNSIIQLQEISPDCDAKMIAIDLDFIKFSEKEDPFTHFLQGQRNVRMTLTKEQRKQMDAFFSLMWKVLQEPVFRKEVVQHLVTAFIYNIQYIAEENPQIANNRLSRQEDIFQRFISLVNTYNKTERNVNFYAEKLYLTPRYLNTVIRQVSQQTVMEWINQAVTQEAKVLLKHSNLLVYQIADELNFPNPSFFCKFFKRMTGMTPQEYQRK